MNLDDLIPGCYSCDQQGAGSRPPREEVVHTEHWRVAHAFNSTLPGWLVILPTRKPGWNKYVVPQAVPDVAALFGDAQIVWKGTAAYSPSPTTTELIAATSGVTALTSLAANDEIWVKY